MAIPSWRGMSERRCCIACRVKRAVADSVCQCHKSVAGALGIQATFVPRWAQSAMGLLASFFSARMLAGFLYGV